LRHEAPAALGTKLQGFFVGQLMKRTGGRADPKLASRILSEQLKG
jgi:aspartyl-tRNA(Asn)/glutamyl-tRNA(Gln) amidotransferase subunit B